jgi:predicted phage terminase large subunit-like protein
VLLYNNVYVAAINLQVDLGGNMYKWLRWFFLGEIQVESVMLREERPQDEFFVDITCWPSHQYYLYDSPNSKGAVSKNCHILLTDDAVVEDKALSKTVREKLVKDYPSKHRSRLFMNYAGAEVLVGTRWVQGDLHDYLATIDKSSASPWDIWRFPALLDEAGSAMLRRKGDPAGYLTPDTSFWPEFQPTDRLVSVRSSYENNMARWNAVFLQDPTPESGSILKAESFKRWTKPVRPPIHTIIISADTAYTKETYSDPSAFVVVGLWNDSFGGQKQVTNAILLDYLVKKISYIELVDTFATLYAKHSPDFILVEEAASGLAIVPELRKRGYPVRSFKTKKDKILKANSVAPIIDSGRFYVPMPEGNMNVIQRTQEFLTEMSGFPDRPHDDLVDAVTNLFLYLKEQGIIAPDEWKDYEAYEPHDDEDTVSGGGSTYYRR